VTRLLQNPGFETHFLGELREMYDISLLSWIDSLIELERQAEKLKTFISEGTLTWAGKSCKQGLIETCTAMLADADHIVKTIGPDVWVDEKANFAKGIINELTKAE